MGVPAVRSPATILLIGDNVIGGTIPLNTMITLYHHSDITNSQRTIYKRGPDTSFSTTDTREWTDPLENEGSRGFLSLDSSLKSILSINGFYRQCKLDTKDSPTCHVPGFRQLQVKYSIILKYTNHVIC